MTQPATTESTTATQSRRSRFRQLLFQGGPLIALVLGVPLMLVVLWLVLAKPDLTPLIERMPMFLREPQDRELPPDLVPI